MRDLPVIISSMGSTFHQKVYMVSFLSHLHSLFMPTAFASEDQEVLKHVYNTFGIETTGPNKTFPSGTSVLPETMMESLTNVTTSWG